MNKIIVKFVGVVLAGALLVPTPGVAQMRGAPDLVQLVKQVGQTVVFIETAENIRDPENKKTNETRPRGSGSGFIVSSNGLVMTNAHVVDGADEIVVTLTNKRMFNAKIIGVDRLTDVALIKIEATGLPVVKLGDATLLEAGEWVFAIGAPFGFTNTVTAGIVSNTKRDTGDYLSFIQTDVVINPGNSGGPLFNLRGKIVGINSQIYSSTGGYMGISFAIPINDAMHVGNQLLAAGNVSYGSLGIQFDEVTKEIAKAISLPEARGVLVSGIAVGGAAALAGIESGDIILKFAGKVINKPVDLRRLVAKMKPGSESTISIYRRGYIVELPITLGKYDPTK